MAHTGKALPASVAKTEKLVLRRITASMPAIEHAISSWDSAGQKPADLKPKVMRLKRFYNEISSWRRRYGAYAGRPPEKKLAMLREFVSICYAYESAAKVRPNA